MPVDIDSPEGHIIRKMVPFSTMPNSIFKVICDKIVVETVRSGAFLFQRGDTAKELIYLLKGEVSLEVDKLKMEVIKAGSESARFALAHQLPRKVNGVAKGTVQFARLHSIYITTPAPGELKKAKSTATPPSEQTAIKEPIKGDSHNWLSTLLMVSILRSLPPAQLSKITERLEEVLYTEGEIVVSTGEASEYYYLIKSGECSLACKSDIAEQVPVVNKLKMWDSFGSEALITGNPSTYTVTALTELSLLRLHKKHFLTLLKEPLLKFITSSDMETILFRGGVLLDVRSTVEYETLHLDNAINIPMTQLRNGLTTLNKTHPVVVFSDDQKVSQAAAFLLLSKRFNVWVLCDEQSEQENLIEPKTFEFLIDTPEVAHPRHNEPAAETTVAAVKPPSHEDLNAVANTSPEVLALENSQLQQQLKMLNIKLEQAEREKQEIMQKYKKLLQEFERIKAILVAKSK